MEQQEPDLPSHPKQWQETVEIYEMIFGKTLRHQPKKVFSARQKMNDRSPNLLPRENVQATTPGRRIQSEPRGLPELRWSVWGDQSGKSPQDEVRQRRGQHGVKLQRSGESSSQVFSKVLTSTHMRDDSKLGKEPSKSIRGKDACSSHGAWNSACSQCGKPNSLGTGTVMRRVLPQ